MFYKASQGDNWAMSSPVFSGETGKKTTAVSAAVHKPE
jgi:hypothetical protein